MSADRPLITVDGAMWVLLLTAIAYAVAFQYEAGYASHFGLTLSLVDVSLLSLYRSLMSVGAIAGLVFLLESAVVAILLEGRLKIKASVLNRCFTAGAILYALLAGIFHVRFAWVVSGGFLVVLAAHLIAPNFTVKKKLSYPEKVAMSDARLAAAVMPPHLPRRFAPVLVAILVIGTAFQVAEEAGQSEAREQKRFLVADTSPPCVFVDTRGDTLVCAEFAGNQLLGNFHLLSKEDDLKLTLKNVGPLKSVPAQ